MSIALEADVDALAAQLLFGKFEQRHKAVAGSLRQDGRWNINIESAIDKQSLPLDFLLLAERMLEAEEQRIRVVGYFIKVNELE